MGKNSQEEGHIDHSADNRALLLSCIGAALLVVAAIAVSHEQ